MIKKGDRVKMLSDTTTGIVSSVNGAVANVTIEDGFDIPVLITDLVAVASEDEKKAMAKMGVGDGTPVNTAGGAKTPVREKAPKPPRDTNRYGRIALADDYEDEEEVDLSHIRDIYLKKVERHFKGLEAPGGNFELV